MVLVLSIDEVVSVAAAGVEVEVEVGACFFVVLERHASVGVGVVEAAAGGCSSMRVAVCSRAMGLRVVLSERQRKKTHETASRWSVCGSRAAETSWKIPSPRRRCGLLAGWCRHCWALCLSDLSSARAHRSVDRAPWA